MDYVEFNKKHGWMYERIPGSRISVLAEYGPEVGRGWLPFLDSCFTLVAIELATSPDPDFALIEVKEKWGHLNILSRGGNERIDALLAKAEALSYMVCEECGAFGLLRKFENGWYATACGSCATQRGEHQLIWGRAVGG